MKNLIISILLTVFLLHIKSLFGREMTKTVDDCSSEKVSFQQHILSGGAIINQTNPGARLHVVILIFDGVQIIDYTGPYEVFGSCGYHVFTVSGSLDTVTTTHNMKVFPDYTFSDHPRPDIIVVPGGNVAHSLLKTDAGVQWLLSQNSGNTRYLGVCNGVFILASAGLLDGKEATTTATMIDHLEMIAPRSTVIYNKRYTQTGNIFTCGGFMAGIDGALGVVKELEGEPATRLLANNLEYNWQTAYVRSELADIWIPKYLDVFPPLYDRDVLKYKGDTDHWEAIFVIRRQESVQNFSEQLKETTSMYRWKEVSHNREEGFAETEYHFEDSFKRKWSLRSVIKNHSVKGEILLEITVLKKGVRKSRVIKFTMTDVTKA